MTGVLFDKIESQARPWCPEPHLLPIDRSEIKTLQEWESLATRSVPNYPYAKSGGRYNAYWRTHMADYAGSRRATEKESNYFETWANRGEWDSRVQDHLHAPNERRWPKVDVNVGQIMGKMSVYMVEKGYVSVKGMGMMKSRSERIADYERLRKRIYSASVGRAMFVTSKGFIGLAPWNPQQGDVVSVLFGGCTPFILRKTIGEEKYILVGEAYVYGIMGSELFGRDDGGGGMGQARLRDFDIV